MAAPAGATHMVLPTVQHGQVPANLADWQTLLCVCDMTTTPTINPAAQSFVAGLAADASDLQVTDAVIAARPWRRHEVGLFDQTPGAEKLYVGVNAEDIFSAADTAFRAYRGCTGGSFEDDGSGVVSADTAAFWPLCEAAGNLEDWSANGLDAVRTNAPQTTGQVGYGLQFDGDDWLNVAHGGVLAFDGTHRLTVGFWFNIGAGFKDWIFACRSGNQLFGARIGSAGITYFLREADGTLRVGAAGSHDVDDDAWHHCAVTYDGPGDAFRAYIDGGLDLEDTSGVTLASTINAPLTIGALSSGTEPYATGPIDEGLWVLSTGAGSAWTIDEAVAYHNMTSDFAAWCVCGAEVEVVHITPPLRAIDVAVAELNATDPWTGPLRAADVWVRMTR